MAHVKFKIENGVISVTEREDGTIQINVHRKGETFHKFDIHLKNGNGPGKDIVVNADSIYVAYKD